MTLATSNTHTRKQGRTRYQRAGGCPVNKQSVKDLLAFVGFFLLCAAFVAVAAFGGAILDGLK